ncbi:MAG: SdiA-regulated domain-containing protein [Archangiaceae bacterium]|nr:SdiA-regulated domain-containing protein [Archangiaceae bacterium]
MKTRVDWGAWLSMAAIAVVCVVVASRWLPALGEGGDPAAEPASPAPEAASPRDEPLRPVKKPKATDNLRRETRSGYSINAPQHSYELAPELGEISDLALAADGQSLWAVHDEQPTLFRIGFDGQVLEQVDLGKKGDYESVAQVGDSVYVGRSDGEILVVDPKAQKVLERIDVHRRVGMACDMEGMAFDPKGQRLLLSCKNESLKSRQNGKAYELWEVSLDTKKVKKEPAYEIAEKALDQVGVKGKEFAPSGIAVHPKTGDLYLVSSRGKMMVVVGQDGEVKSAEDVDQKVHRQLEGIAFAADGTMYLSDEAHGHKAMLHVVSAP